MKSPRALVVLLPLLVMLLPVGLHAQMMAQMRRPSKISGPVDISAREMNYNKEENIYTAQGDVELREGARKLNADFVLFNDTTKDAFAEGHVVFQEMGDVINAEKMSLNLETQRGTIENGRIFMKTGNFYMNGKEIEKTGESSYLVHNGQFTTCGWERPSWTFLAKEVKITMGEYAVAQSTTFTASGHKVLYLPWSLFPVKAERQSGLLLPQLQTSSRDGPIIRTAYYWAIAQDKDATFFLDWIQQRGFKPGAEYRYWLTDTTKGAWYVSGIDDAKYGHDRYQIKGQHEQVFGEDLTFKTNINYVSDYQYLQDLGRTTLERSESSLRDVAFIEKPLPKSLLTVETAYFQDLTQKNNSNTIQYLPSGYYFTEYMPFMKNKAYADIASDLTTFSQGNERYTRFSASPSMQVPYAWNGLNFLGTGAFLEKAYYTDPAQSDVKDTVHHEAVSVQGDMNAQFVKQSSTQLFGLGETQSIITPRLQYNYQKNVSSFGDIPSIDPLDRLFDTNTATYSFNHYFNAVKDGQVREISLLEISQTYGITSKLPGDPYLYQGSGNRLSQVHSRFTLFPNSTFWYVHDDYWDVSGQGLQNMVNSIHYALPPRFQIDVSHSYAPGLVDQVWVNTIIRWRVIDVNYQIRYDFIERTWLNTLAAITYHPGCWSITLSLIQTKVPKDTSFHFSFNLTGITQKIGGY